MMLTRAARWRDPQIRSDEVYRVSVSFLFADYDALGPVVAAAGLVFYAFVVLIALVCKAFRSWTAVLFGVVAAAVVSWAAVSAFIGFMTYGDTSNLSAGVANILLAAVVLFAFVWTSPFIQFFILRPSRRREIDQAWGQWRPRMAIIPCLAVALFQGCVVWSIVLKGGTAGGTDTAIIGGLVICAQFLTFLLFARPPTGI